MRILIATIVIIVLKKYGITIEQGPAYLMGIGFGLAFCQDVKELFRK